MIPDPLPEPSATRVRGLVELVRALSDAEYYWFRDKLADLPEVQMCCLRRGDCSCYDYCTPRD